MDLLDFIIGANLMNTMPHYILGVWKGKMLSGFGIGNRRNILWGIANFILSISLFLYKYGISAIYKNGVYSGAAFIVVVFFFTAPLWHRYYYRGEN